MTGPSWWRADISYQDASKKICGNRDFSIWLWALQRCPSVTSSMKRYGWAVQLPEGAVQRSPACGDVRTSRHFHVRLRGWRAYQSLCLLWSGRQQIASLIRVEHWCPSLQQPALDDPAVDGRCLCLSTRSTVGRPDNPSIAHSTKPYPCGCHDNHTTPPQLCTTPDGTERRPQRFAPRRNYRRRPGD